MTDTMKNLSGMIDVGDKDITRRVAVAQSKIFLPEVLLQKIKNDEIPKGNVLEHARIAGIFAAKKVPDLIPMCHPIHISKIDVGFNFFDGYILIEAEVRANDRTGVEIEAITAVSLAAITIYDMCKMFGYEMSISDTVLLHKSGGKSGEYIRH